MRMKNKLAGLWRAKWQDLTRDSRSESEFNKEMRPLAYSAKCKFHLYAPQYRTLASGIRLALHTGESLFKRHAHRQWQETTIRLLERKLPDDALSKAWLSMKLRIDILILILAGESSMAWWWRHLAKRMCAQNANRRKIISETIKTSTPWRIDIYVKHYNQCRRLRPDDLYRQLRFSVRQRSIPLVMRNRNIAFYRRARRSRSRRK